MDVGTPESYLQAHHDILDGRLHYAFEGEELNPRVFVGENTTTADTAMIFGPTVIGSNCQIEENVLILGRTTIGVNCHIKKGSRIEGAVIYDNCQIGPRSTIRNSLLGKDITIGQDVLVDEVSVLGDQLEVGNNNIFRRGIRLSVGEKIPEGMINF